MPVRCFHTLTGTLSNQFDPSQTIRSTAKRSLVRGSPGSRRPTPSTTSDQTWQLVLVSLMCGFGSLSLCWLLSSPTVRRSRRTSTTSRCLLTTRFPCGGTALSSSLLLLWPCMLRHTPFTRRNRANFDLPQGYVLHRRLPAALVGSDCCSHHCNSCVPSRYSCIRRNVGLISSTSIYFTQLTLPSVSQWFQHGRAATLANARCCPHPRKLSSQHVLHPLRRQHRLASSRSYS